MIWSNPIEFLLPNSHAFFLSYFLSMRIYISFRKKLLNLINVVFFHQLVCVCVCLRVCVCVDSFYTTGKKRSILSAWMSEWVKREMSGIKKNNNITRMHCDIIAEIKLWIFSLSHRFFLIFVDVPPTFSSFSWVFRLLDFFFSNSSRFHWVKWDSSHTHIHT